MHCKATEPKGKAENETHFLILTNSDEIGVKRADEVMITFFIWSCVK